MPKLDTTLWTDHPGAANRLSGQNDGPYAELVLGDQARLTQFGVRLERLPPGSRSSHRHWHETEDEFVYVLAGELVLVEDETSVLRAGEAAGWAAGAPVGHCLENRSASEAVYLVVGSRASKGVVHYPDHDVVMHHDGTERRFTRGDGSPIERE
ncbi:cupin domain-containing protein [Mitsuaria sp. GD03876]|uniref:cupin domain-containing protein n=1 Tax=Mitsuaria sp. GD03876 TaxID=2975399 RepID=UPI002449F397|nr:cupin domain-containing protein [Mitsuaria sp. GD03876]MDH0865378.1 cupin domain-containing protein [Mitsuaria sp. GD03876]